MARGTSRAGCNCEKNKEVHLFPIADDWLGTLSIATQSNSGTGSSIIVYVGSCWVPHNNLIKEIAPEMYTRKVSYSSSLYDHVSDDLKDQVGTWRVQDGPQGALDLSLPLRAVQECGFDVMHRMCTVDFALAEFKKRSELPRAAAPASLNYVLALELVGEHSLAVEMLDFFLEKEAAKGKFASPYFPEVAERFRGKFGS